jgi:uncharacterized protein YyaL (SSP411 family)
MQTFTIEETAHYFKLLPESVREQLSVSRMKLLAERNERPRPHLDDKIVTSWNGLMISAFAKAYQVLQEPIYLDRALKAARFFKQNMYHETTGTLIRSYRESPSKVDGFLEDYAFLIQGKCSYLYIEARLR